MFEKEAEEYYYKTYPVTLNIGEEERKKEVTDIFIKGAEFGYNKGKEEVEQWHILAENPKDVPAENSVVKVLTEDNIIQESTYFYDDYFEEMAFSNVGLVKVLAWKEIVLPELLKENE